MHDLSRFAVLSFILLYCSSQVYVSSSLPCSQALSIYYLSMLLVSHLCKTRGIIKFARFESLTVVRMNIYRCIGCFMLRNKNKLIRENGNRALKNYSFKIESYTFTAVIFLSCCNYKKLCADTRYKEDFFYSLGCHFANKIF